MQALLLLNFMPTLVVVLVLCAVLCLVIAFSLKSKRKGCYHCSEVGKKIKVHDRNPKHYAYCVRLSIEGMICAQCKRKMENELNAKGAVWAEVDLKTGSALVRTKEALPDVTLRRIVARAGYTLVGVERIDKA